VKGLYFIFYSLNGSYLSSPNKYIVILYYIKVTKSSPLSALLIS